MQHTAPNLDERIRAVCAAVFNVDPASLSDAASPETVPEWDSLSHLTLVLALESEFGVAFEADEIPALDNLARIRARVAQG